MAIDVAAAADPKWLLNKTTQRAAITPCFFPLNGQILKLLVSPSKCIPSKERYVR